jgi:hypothetical protein
MNFFKNLKKTFRNHGYLILIIVLFVVGTLLRLYNFQNRLIFGPEQGMSLITSAQNLQKFSLLGETNLIRVTSAGHIPFHGALYSYLILPLLLLFNYRVLPITLFFTLLNLVTAFVFFKVTLRLFGKATAALSLFFFLFSGVMIHHSLFAWIVNPTPLLGVLSLWFVSVLTKNRKKLSPVFWLGFMSGFGFGLQNFYLLFALFLFVLILFISKKRLLAIISFLIGVIVGSLPTVVFDIRHDFYHIRTYWQFFFDLLTGKASGTSTYYNYLFLYPFIFLFYAFITKILYKVWKPLALIPLVFFLYTNLNSSFINFNKSVGMAPGITLKSLESAAAIIASDNPPTNFNVATLWDFDTRANPMRYLLTYYYDKIPQPYDQYQNVAALYVFAPDDYDIKNPRVWELQTYLPYKVTTLPLSVPGYFLYKLTK